jgi:hypothetical protein
VYGVELTPDLMRDRTWSWFLIRLAGLFTRAHLIEQFETRKGVRLVRVPTTRLGTILTPPDWGTTT